MNFKGFYFNRYNMTDEELKVVSLFSLKVKGFEARNMTNGLFDGYYYYDLEEEIQKEKEEVKEEYKIIKKIIFKMKRTKKPNKDD